MKVEIKDNMVTMTIEDYSLLQYRADRYDDHASALMELHELLESDISEERRRYLMSEFHHHVQPFKLELEAYVYALQAMPLES